MSQSVIPINNQGVMMYIMAWEQLRGTRVTHTNYTLVRMKWKNGWWGAKAIVLDEQVSKVMV